MKFLPWREELDEDKRFLGDGVEVAGSYVDNVGGVLRDGDGDEREGGQGAKKGRELHDGREEERAWNEPNDVLVTTYMGGSLVTSD